jgi:hypothetical protein
VVCSLGLVALATPARAQAPFVNMIDHLHLAAPTGLSENRAIQFTVQSAIVEMSLTKIRLPEIDGAGHVALLATV